MNHQLPSIFQNFCLCDIQIQLQPAIIVPPPIPVAYKCQRQVKTIHTFDFTKDQDKLKSKLYPLLGTGAPFVRAKKKASVWKGKKVSKRRSRFTGVTKNSINYQTLIVVGGKKTYVGSYPLEVDAAITFDFYSLMLHKEKASTNFSWRAEDIFEMMDSFNWNDGVFDPTKFHYKL